MVKIVRAKREEKKKARCPLRIFRGKQYSIEKRAATLDFFPFLLYYHFLPISSFLAFCISPSLFLSQTVPPCNKTLTANTWQEIGCIKNIVISIILTSSIWGLWSYSVWGNWNSIFKISIFNIWHCITRCCNWCYAGVYKSLAV